MSEDRFKEEVMRYLSAIAVDVGDIRAKVSNLEDRVEKIEGELGEVKIAIKSLETKVEESSESLRSEVKRLRFMVGEMANNLLEVRADLHDHEKRIIILEDKPA